MARRLAAAALPGVLGVLPEPLGRGLCVLIGRVAHRTVRRDRVLAEENLRRVFGGSREATRREARMVFEEIGRNVYDFARYPLLGEARRRRLVLMDGGEHLDAARGEGRGVLLVAGHLGSWEILAAHLAREGYPFLALARPLREPALDRLLESHRRAMGFRTLSDREGPLRAARHLAGGGILGALIDQRPRRGEGTEVRFLEQPTRMVTGPARLALATGASVIPAGIMRLPGHRHRIRILPPLALPDGDDAPVRLTQAMADAVGSLILEAPRQWIWIHPRWEDRTGAAT